MSKQDQLADVDLLALDDDGKARMIIQAAIDEAFFNVKTERKEPLTFEKIRELHRLFNPPIYYAINEHVPEFGEDKAPVFFHLPEGDYSPETMVCHPSHAERLLGVLMETGRPVMHLRDWVPAMPQMVI